MFSILQNLPQVTKNILIINIIMFLAYLFMLSSGTNLNDILGAHAIGSPLFKPFQIITYSFMHANFMHILLNMWLFVMLGAYLEKLWGAKRFFIFYISCALGALVFELIFMAFQMNELRVILNQNINTSTIDNIIKTYKGDAAIVDRVNLYLNQNNVLNVNIEALQKYIQNQNTAIVGASGGVFGILAAFAILFPNTEFYLYFAIPVKAKYLVGAYFLWELYQSFQNNPQDNVAHLAHVGGAVVGAVFVIYWRKTNKTHFW